MSEETRVVVGPAAHELLRLDTSPRRLPGEVAVACECGGGTDGLGWHTSSICPVPLMVWRRKAFDLARRLDELHSERYGKGTAQ